MKKSLFILLAALMAMPMMAKKTTSQFPGWSPVHITTGDQPGGITCRPVRSGVDNFLELEVGGQADAIVKVRAMVGDTMSHLDPVIRVVYVKCGDTYRVLHLPQAKCYLEAAYGNLFYRSDSNKKKYRFMQDNYFVRLSEVFDFHVTRDSMPDGSYTEKTPSYRMMLKLTITVDGKPVDRNGKSPGDFRSVAEEPIPEDEFYK